MIKQFFPHKQIGAFIGRNLGTIVGVTTNENVIALTFDDGPHPEFTPRLLDILARHQAHATFFMVGKSAQNHREIMDKVKHAGHAIGIHGWDHSSFPKIGIHEQRNQIRSCARVFEPYKDHIFRPPYGHQNPVSHLNVRSLGYEVIGWDLDVADWLFRDSVSMANELMDKMQPGSIVLLHDAICLPEAGINSNRQSTLDAVDLLLGGLRNNVKFITVPELFSYGRPKRVNWYRN